MIKNILYLLAAGILLYGCAAAPVEVTVIRIKGSDTMYELTSYLAGEYMKEHPGTSIYVDGGGTSTGVKALISGNADISTASRILEPDEIKLFAEQYGSLGMSIMIAKDALSVFVNKNNKVKDFSLEELKNIYTCGVKNWSELGGDDVPIRPVIRPPNSGTHFYFKEHILEGKEYCASAIIEETTDEVLKRVENDVQAIGYGGIGFGSSVVHAKVNGVEATENNVRNNTYPIQRYLYFYTLQSPGGAVKKFIDWVISPEGQQKIKEAGYVPIWEISF